MEFVPVAFPQSASQLSVMESILEAHDIHYFVLNRGFGSLYPGMHLHIFNSPKIMVLEVLAEEAFDLLSAFRLPVDDFEIDHKLRWSDKLRVIAELICGSWCVPIRRKRIGKNDEL